MPKEVTVKQGTALPAELTDLSQWGMPAVLGNDIIIPKILPMQPSSDLVTDMKAQIGEFRDSLSGEKLGSIVEPIEVIPFHVEKYWDILVEKGDQFEWDASIPLIEDPAKAGYNDNLPWKDTVEGVNIKRVRRMNFYVLLPAQMAEGSSLPYIFSFKSTSFVEGKKVYSQMYMRNVRAKLPPAAYTFKIAGVKTKNEKGTFIVPTVELGRRSTVDEIKEAFEWFKIVSKGGVRVDDSDLKESSGVVDTTGTGQF